MHPDGSDYGHIRDCRRPKRILAFFEISDYGHIRDCRNRGEMAMNIFPNIQKNF